MRLAIYAIYDKGGRIDDYITYFAGKLRSVADDLIVVSNIDLPQSEKEKLSMADRIYEREDIGYDAGAFAYVLDNLSVENELERYDEIIFLNDSIFGPFYPLEEMFSKMDQNQELDFWGITERGEADFDGGDEIYPEHIQLYFYVVRKNMLHSQDFKGYWREIPERITDFRSAIINYEFAFTRYFSDKGYKWDVYCHTDELVTEYPKINLSPYHYCIYKLIKEKGCPVLKRKLFTGDAIDGRFTDKSDLRQAISYIRKHTDYDCDLMWQHILRAYPIGDVIEGAQLYELLEAGHKSDLTECCAVRVIDYHGIIASHIVPIVDVITDDSAKYTFYVSVEANYMEPYRLYCAEVDCVVQNMFADRAYVSSIVELFEQDTRLGVLVPPISTFGKIKRSVMKEWQNADLAEDFIKRYDVRVPMKQEAPIHAIHAFWCRSNILNDKIVDELREDSTGTVMQLMPLLAQQKGYYTKVLINQEYAACQLANLQGLLRDFCGMSYFTSRRDGNSDMDIEQMRDTVYMRRITEFVRNKEYVYIYGAGQLACRMVKIMEEMRKPDGIVVSDTNGNVRNLCGYEVMCIDKIRHTNCSIIVAVGKKNNLIIENKLRQADIHDYLLLE